MKAGWDEVRLDDLCKIARGGSPRPIKAFVTDADDGINWIKIGDTEMGGRYIDSTKEKIKPSGIARSRYVEAGSFLLSNSMSFGRPYILRTNGCIHDGWLVLEPDYSRVDQEFLYYALSSRFVFDQFNSLAAGATVRNLNIDLVSKVITPIPPLEEQKRIVAVLDAAFEGLTRAKENAEANLQNARELFEAEVSSEFAALKNDFGSKRIGDVADHRLGKMLDKNKNRGVPRGYLRNKNVQWFEIDTTDLLEMRIEESEVARYSAETGDLLICEGGYPGRAAIWTEVDPIFYQKALHRVRFAEPIYNRLLLYWLYLLDQTGQLSAHCSGAGIQHFTGKSLAKFEMPYPSLEAASKAVRSIEDTKRQSEDLEEHYRTKLTDIADLRQSLLQKAFAGELT